MRLSAKAPAKINLTLDILGRRPDGYHDVSMLMQAVSLYETVTVTAEPGDTPDADGEITVTCDRPGVPCDSSNIAYKAAKAFFSYCKMGHGNMTIHIEKKIPFGAGLAGGSADGAAVIVILNRMYETHLKESELCEIGAKVGADVPFCIVGGTCHATGTGTTLKKTRNLPKCHIVICKPEISISTAEAYALADKRTGGTYSYTDLCIPALFSASVRNVSDFLHNDFEEVLCLPEINKVKKIMYGKKALGAAMSGSGSAVFGIFISKSAAVKCAEELQKEYKEVFVTEPVKVGCEILPE
ncbi:MAG: 4-(cytidine 5'-diphospho)-2-C-methyl-D-erythritol kinase [Eubacteriales bacterium]|nr:4-(cytidine 5'-diphospho)-2-C-methyl-D-erythritol kinase [Eubacteriales bacterium]